MSDKNLKRLLIGWLLIILIIGLIYLPYIALQQLGGEQFLVSLVHIILIGLAGFAIICVIAVISNFIRPK